ncbi:MAG: glycosyltransferase family 4 protein [Alphaproteobacteria bacterium]
MSPPRPSLLYLVTEDWAFLSHRLPMARAAMAAGFDVSVACRVGTRCAEIEALGIRVHPLQLARGSMNPLRELAAIVQITRLYWREKPDIVHHVALKPTLYGSIAARLAGIGSVVNATAGLGFVFVSPRKAARIARPLILSLFRTLLGRKGSVILLQNSDDVALFVANRIARREEIELIRGSGVDVDSFAKVGAPPDAEPVIAAYVGRMIEDKGVAVLVEAQQILAARGTQLSLRLCGAPDPENPTSIDREILEKWAQAPGVEWLGEVGDIAEMWKTAHIAVLASRREGLPLSLMEAAACGRPIIATDVPGCREIAIEGKNAILVPVDDAAKLADALEVLAGDQTRRAAYGAASRELVKTDLSDRAVGARIVALYNRMLERNSARAGSP